MIQGIIDELSALAREKALAAAYGAGAADTAGDHLDAVPPKARDALYSAGEARGVELSVEIVRAIFRGEKPPTQLPPPKPRRSQRKAPSLRKQKTKPQDLMIPIGKLFNGSSDAMTPRDVIQRLGWEETQELVVAVIRVLKAAVRKKVLEFDRPSGRYRKIPANQR